LASDSIIVGSVTPALSLQGALNLKVEEIAPTEEVAASQAAALNTLVLLARGFTAPLSENTANSGLKQILKSADVTASRNRVVVKATLAPSLLSSLVQAEDSSPSAAPAH
jgi:hypothetical protein